MIGYYIYYALGIVLIPGIVLGIWAQIKVSSTFNKYNNIATKSEKEANRFARHMLDSSGYTDVGIVQINGELTDNFNPKTNTVSLSKTFFLGIAITSNCISSKFYCIYWSCCTRNWACFST